ncbi:MAG: site-specific integrase [Oscillospiraceae bacterium]|nr:site-specific integrase [Oscillospiraceae bacterium]
MNFTMGQRVTVENNIKMDKESKKFYVTFYYGKNDQNKAIRKTKVFDNLELARKALKIHVAGLVTDSILKPNKLILSEYIEQFLIMKKYAETTLYGYRNIAKHIKNQLIGNMKIQEIKVNHILNYYQKLRELDLSEVTIKKHYSFLHLIFMNAFDNEIINKNVMSKEALKITASKPDIVCFNAMECKACLQLMQAEKSMLYIPSLLAASLSLRREEVLGAKWSDINWENQTIHINRAITSAGSKVILKNTKNEKSERTLFLPNSLIKRLKEEKEFQKKMKSFFKEQYTESDYIVRRNDGKPWRPNYISECFTKFIKDNNLKENVTFHGLRHTFATVACESGINPISYGKAMGHSRVDTTEHYTHKDENTHEVTTNTVCNAILDDNI